MSTRSGAGASGRIDSFAGPAPSRCRMVGGLVGAGGGIAGALVGGARQADRDRRPLAGLRLELKRAAVRLDELPGQRQAEAERRLLVSTPLDSALKAIKDTRLIGQRAAAIASAFVASAAIAAYSVYALL